MNCNPLLASQLSIVSHTLTLNCNNEANSNCPEPISDHKDIKFHSSNITKLWYDSNIAQFNNQLEDLKVVFYEDPTKYSINYYKIILISMVINKQLKMTYNI